jgi:hypothetical protein
MPIDFGRFHVPRAYRTEHHVFVCGGVSCWKHPNSKRANKVIPGGVVASGVLSFVERWGRLDVRTGVLCELFGALCVLAVSDLISSLTNARLVADDAPPCSRFNC